MPVKMQKKSFLFAANIIGNGLLASLLLFMALYTLQAGPPGVLQIVHYYFLLFGFGIPALLSAVIFVLMAQTPSRIQQGLRLQRFTGLAIIFHGVTLLLVTWLFSSIQDKSLAMYGGMGGLYIVVGTMVVAARCDLSALLNKGAISK